MLNLKKAAAAVLALGSSAAFAGTMGPVCTPGSVTVPCEKNAWDFGAQALYLQASGDNYVNVRPANGANVYENLNQDWGWGFKIEGSYHFNTGNDLNINWYHFQKDTKTNLVRPAVNNVNEVVGARIEPRWDAVNLELGQRVQFGEQKNIRFHGGLQYAHTEREFSFRSAGVTQLYGETKFDGIGPRLGMDLSYELGNGLAIYGNTAGALLVGDSKFRNTAATTLPSVASSYGKKTQIVPELEAKLGLAYTHSMAQGDLTFDAGWMWVNYFAAQHNPEGSIDTSSYNPASSNFALNGPFVGAKWVGNVA